MTQRTDQFATAIDCMDGRTKQPIRDWIQKEFPKITYIDTITDAGPVGKLGRGKNEEYFRTRVMDISVAKHGSTLLLIAAHDDCAGNPVGEQEQRQHIRASVDRAISWGFSGLVIGLWVNDQWSVEEITRKSAA